MIPKNKTKQKHEKKNTTEVDSPYELIILLLAAQYGVGRGLTMRIDEQLAIVRWWERVGEGELLFCFRNMGTVRLFILEWMTLYLCAYGQQ